MNYRELHNLRVGDTVFYVAIRWREMVIEKHTVTKVFDNPAFGRAAFLDGGKLGDNLYLNDSLCFLSIDEASEKLKQIIEHSKQPKEESAYEIIMRETFGWKKPSKPKTKELITV